MLCGYGFESCQLCAAGRLPVLVGEPAIGQGFLDDDGHAGVAGAAQCGSSGGFEQVPGGLYDAEQRFSVRFYFDGLIYQLRLLGAFNGQANQATIVTDFGQSVQNFGVLQDATGLGGGVYLVDFHGSSKPQAAPDQ